MKVSGIYIIINKITKKYYIGESSNVKVRLRIHKSDLLRSDHQNIHLQRSFNKHGLENFEFEILDECEVSHCKSLEHYWCNILDAHNDKYGFNIRKTSNEDKSGGIAASSRHLMSIAKKGKKLSPEHINKLSIAQKRRGPNQFRSAKAKEVISNANKSRAKPVYQIDRNGNIIKLWNSRHDASVALSIGVSSINNSSLGISKTAGGFFWKFKNHITA